MPIVWNIEAFGLNGGKGDARDLKIHIGKGLCRPCIGLFSLIRGKAFS